MKPNLKKPYPEVKLSKNAQSKTALIHRLVADAFVEGHFEGARVNQHSDRYPHLTAQERYKLFNEALGCLCDTLEIDLDMYDLFQQGEISQEVYEDTTQAEHDQDEPDSIVTLADELKDLYALNDSMFTGDPNHVPTYTDGTVIRQQDLADMNMNGLQRIAEIIGIELGE